MIYLNMPEYSNAYDLLAKEDEFYIEMSRQEASVLCGLIEKFRPNKIVEIGVAAGGSTCLILKCLELLGMNTTEMISMDINVNFYRGKEKETGYLLTENRQKYKCVDKHKLLLGKYAVDNLEEIKGDIDLLFLDTVHSMPGEILDFLLLYPYLSKSAIVVMHDTNLHTIRGSYSMSNRVLVNSVTAFKFYNSDYQYLNIGAFQINVDTKKYIENTFAALLLPWAYMPEEKMLQAYEWEYKKYYSLNAIEIWENAIECAKKRQEIVNKECIDEGERKIEGVFSSNKKVYLYGCGHRGRILLDYLKRKEYMISGIIVSDDVPLAEMDDFGYTIYHYSEILEREKDSIILLATAAPEVRNRLERGRLRYLELEGRFFDLI